MSERELDNSLKDTLSCVTEYLQWTANDARILVLCSGGADSSLLAHILAQHRSIELLHINYKLRHDSDQQQLAVTELSQRLGVKLHVYCPTLPDGNVQHQARLARYEKAEQLMEERDLQWVATGHTRSDIVETLLHRLLHAPGTKALATLSPVTDQLIRPLYQLTRDQVRQAANELELPFSDDSSNAKDIYARNRIRNTLVPLIRELEPSYEKTIAQTHQELLAERDYFERLGKRLSEKTAQQFIAYAAVEQLQLIEQRALYRYRAQQIDPAASVNLSQTEQITRLLADGEGGEVQLGGGLSAFCQSYRLVFAHTLPQPQQAEVPLSVPGQAELPTETICAEIVPPSQFRRTTNEAFVDAQSLQGKQLIVRYWREGDKIKQLGMNGQHKSVRELFSRGGLPRYLRHQVPLVFADEQLVWVKGYAVSEEYKVTDETTSVCHLYSA